MAKPWHASYIACYTIYIFLPATCLWIFIDTKNSLHFSNIPNKILPRLHLYTNTSLSIRTTPRKPLFLMNSSSLFSVGGSLLTASAPFVTWNYKKVLMQTDPYLCESINVFASIAQFFFVNVLMNSRIFTTCQSRINKYQNLSIHLQFTVIFRRCMSSLRIKLNATC